MSVLFNHGIRYEICNRNPMLILFVILCQIVCQSQLIGFKPKRQKRSKTRDYCNFAYSALDCFRMGRSGSASFQVLKKSWYAAFALAVSPAIA
jgi:hypothetical protein